MKKYINRLNNTQVITEINSKPISLEQFAELFGLELYLHQIEKNKWEAYFIGYIPEFGFGIGNTQLQAMSNLTEEIKKSYTKMECVCTEDLSITLGRKGWIKRNPATNHVQKASKKSL